MTPGKRKNTGFNEIKNTNNSRKASSKFSQKVTKKDKGSILMFPKSKMKILTPKNNKKILWKRFFKSNMSKKRPKKKEK